MRHIIQGDKRNCGQIAVAVLTNQPLEVIEKLVGHTHGTRTKELSSALREFGFSSLNRRRVVREFPSKKWFGIIHTRKIGDRRGGHWVAVANGRTWDGCANRSMPISLYAEKLAEQNWKITAALDVW
jgi:hypothetical protein